MTTSIASINAAVLTRVLQTGCVLDTHVVSPQTMSTFTNMLSRRCHTMRRYTGKNTTHINCLVDNCFRTVLLVENEHLTHCIGLCEFVHVITCILETTDLNDEACIWRICATTMDSLPAFLLDIVLAVGYDIGMRMFSTLTENLWLYVLGDMNYALTHNVSVIVGAFTRQLAQYVPLYTLCATRQPINTNVLLYCVSTCIVHNNMIDAATSASTKFNCCISNQLCLEGILQGHAIAENKPDVYTTALCVMEHYKPTKPAAPAMQVGEIHEFKQLTILCNNVASPDAAISYLRVLARKTNDTAFLQTLQTIQTYVEAQNNGTFTAEAFMRYFSIGVFDNVDVADIVSMFCGHPDSCAQKIGRDTAKAIDDWVGHALSLFTCHVANSSLSLQLQKPFICTDEGMFVIAKRLMLDQHTQGAALFALAGGANVKNGQRLPIYLAMTKLFFSGVQGLRWVLAIVFLWITGDAVTAMNSTLLVRPGSERIAHALIVPFIATLLGAFGEGDLFCSPVNDNLIKFAELFLTGCMFDCDTVLKTGVSGMPASGSGLHRVPGHFRAQMAKYTTGGRKDYAGFLASVSVFKLAILHASAQPFVSSVSVADEFHSLSVLMTHPIQTGPQTASGTAPPAHSVRTMALFFALLDMKMASKQTSEFCLQHFLLATQMDVLSTVLPVWYITSNGTYVNDNVCFFVDHHDTGEYNRILSSVAKRSDAYDMLQEKFAQMRDDTDMTKDIYRLVYKFKDL